MLVLTEKIRKQEVAVVTSLDVAETFEKRHADVLRDIEDLKCSEDFRKRNFALSKYEVNGNKRKYPMYYITRDGFILLAMGYAGENTAEISKQILFIAKELDEINNKPKEITVDTKIDSKELYKAFKSFSRMCGIDTVKQNDFPYELFEKFLIKYLNNEN